MERKIWANSGDSHLTEPGDLFEKTSSQMVLKDAKTQKVRDFANMMITDHNKSTMQVKAAANESRSSK